MILVTVGTQIPFDRLIRAMDEIVSRLGLSAFAQIGAGEYKPQKIEFCQTMRPEDFDLRFRAASVIVSHAGIGTVLGAMKHGKPIIIMPRRAAFGEHRNDHQLATCAQLQGRPGVYIAQDANELEALLSRTDLANPEEAALSERRQDFVGRLRMQLQALTR